MHYDGSRMQMREVMAGRGMHTGQQPFILNFGLGKAQQVDSIVIRWPDGNCSRKVIYNPPVNKGVFVHTFPTEVPEQARATEIRVFPNPTEKYVVLQGKELASDVTAVQVLDTRGSNVAAYWSRSDGDKLVFDLGGLPAGLYFIRLTGAGGKTMVHRATRK